MLQTIKGIFNFKNETKFAISQNIKVTSIFSWKNNWEDFFQ